LIDRATRKPSEHTIKAYRQDFAAVSALLTAGTPADIALTDITKNNMRAAFAAYASTHEPASIRRCWSTWNVLCDFLYTNELIPANPMPFVGRPKAAKTLPYSLPQSAVSALLEAVDRDHEPRRRTDWTERDLAVILTGLLAGLRADELRRADVGDIRTTADGGAVIHVGRKGGKDRIVPIEAELLRVIEGYLESRPGASLTH
jgi:integrase/recombinase XerC